MIWARGLISSSTRYLYVKSSNTRWRSMRFRDILEWIAALGGVYNSSDQNKALFISTWGVLLAVGEEPL
jgi:hypothetical protein